MSEECLPTPEPAAGQGGGSVPGATSIDTEYVCDSSTNTWHRIDIVDGVAAAPIDTGIPCDEPMPVDDESYEDCVNGLVEIVFYRTEADGTRTETGRIPTTRSCESDPSVVESVICRNGTEHQVTTQVQPDGSLVELRAIDTGVLCGVQVCFSTECFTDDNGGTLTVFYRRIRTETDETTGLVTETTTGEFTDTDLATPYTPTGTVAPCTGEGSDVVGFSPRMRTLVGPIVWTPPTGVGGFNVSGVVGIANAGTPAVSAFVTDPDNGANQLLFEGLSHSWNASVSDLLLPAYPTFDVPAGAIVSVSYLAPVLG